MENFNLFDLKSPISQALKFSNTYTTPTQGTTQGNMKGRVNKPTVPLVVKPGKEREYAAEQTKKKLIQKKSIEETMGVASKGVPGMMKQVQEVKPKVAPTIIPTANADEGKMTIQQFGDTIKAKYSDYKDIDSTILGQKMLEKYPDYKDIIQETPQVEQPKDKNFFQGFGEKTAESFMGGLGRIGEAGTGYMSGKYDLGESAARIGAGGFQSVFSPISGVVGQGVEEVIKVVPQDFKDYIGGIAKPKVEDVTAWYNSQSPEQKRNLENIGIGVELLLDVTGLKVGGKVAPKVVSKTGDVVDTTKMVGLKLKEKIPSTTGIKNDLAESMLSSQWKLNKSTRKQLEGKIGKSGPKFILENDLIGKTIEDTADNALKFKVNKIKEKIDAVKTFGITETPPVAKNVANVLKNNIDNNVKKSYGKNANILKVLEENHPDLAKVYRLTDDVLNADNIDYTKLEQLKELHDYFNPENIKFDLTGKPESEVGNLLASGKRAQLQKILEDAGNKNGVDIAGINKDIQGAHLIENGLNDTVSRRQNLNLLGLGDTQTAVISAILGGAPAAVGGVLLKRGLTSEGFVGGLAKKLYTKTSKNAKINIPNNSLINPASKSRVDRIMDYSTNSTNVKINPNKINLKNTGLKPETTKIPAKVSLNKEGLNKAETPRIVSHETKKTGGIGKNRGGFVNVGKIAEDVNNASKLLKKPSVSDDLVNEAKKYKTFEEFKKSQGGELYHGTNSSFTEFKLSTDKGRFNEEQIPGIYTTNNKNIANIFTERVNQPSGNIVKAYVDTKKHIVIRNRKELGDLLGLDLINGPASNNTLAKSKLEKMGYDGIIFKGGIGFKGENGNEIITFNPKVIKTEAQLKQIYEQANKPKLIKKN